MTQTDADTHARENNAARLSRQLGHLLGEWRMLLLVNERVIAACCQEVGCLAIVFLDVEGGDPRGTAIWFDCPKK